MARVCQDGMVIEEGDTVSVILRPGFAGREDLIPRPAEESRRGLRRVAQRGVEDEVLTSLRQPRSSERRMGRVPAISDSITDH